MIDNNAKIKEVSLNSPIGRSIYLKNINDNDTHYYVNDKKISIKIINSFLFFVKYNHTHAFFSYYDSRIILEKPRAAVFSKQPQSDGKNTFHGAEYPRI